MEAQVLQDEAGSVSSSAANHSFGTAEHPRCQNPAPNSTENQSEPPGDAQRGLRSVSTSTEEPGTGKAKQG